MITYRKAKAVISVGDVIYYLDENGWVEEAVVKGILADSIATSKGFMDFCLHGDVWWLTKRVAMDSGNKLKNGGRRTDERKAD